MSTFLRETAVALLVRLASFAAITAIYLFTRLQCLLFKHSSASDVEAYTALWLLVRIPHNMKAVLLNKSWEWWQAVIRSVRDPTAASSSSGNANGLSPPYTPNSERSPFTTLKAQFPDRPPSAGKLRSDGGSMCSDSGAPAAARSLDRVRIVSLACDEDVTCNNVVMVWFNLASGPRQDAAESDFLRRVASSTTHFRGLIVADIVSMQAPAPVDVTVTEVERTLSAVSQYLDEHLFGDSPMLLPAGSSLAATVLLLLAERNELFCSQHRVLGVFAIDPFVGWRLPPSAAAIETRSPQAAGGRADAVSPHGQGAASGMTPSCVQSFRRSPSNSAVSPSVVEFFKRVFDRASRQPPLAGKGQPTAHDSKTLPPTSSYGPVHARSNTGTTTSSSSHRAIGRSPPNLWASSLALNNATGLRSWFPDADRHQRSQVRSLFALHRYSIFAMDQAKFVDESGSDWIVVCDSSLSSEDTLLIIATWMHDQALAMCPSVATSLGRSIGTMPSCDGLNADVDGGGSSDERAGGTGMFSISTMGLRRHKSHDGYMPLKAVDISGEDLPALRKRHVSSRSTAGGGVAALGAGAAQAASGASAAANQRSGSMRASSSSLLAHKGGHVCPTIESVEDLTGLS